MVKWADIATGCDWKEVERIAEKQQGVVIEFTEAF